MSYDKTALLLPLNGANGGTVFPDFSRHNRTVTANDNAQTSTAQSQFYGSSGLFDGAGDYLSIPHSVDFNIEATDFYIGAFVYIASSANPQVMVTKRRSGAVGTQGWSFNVTPSVFLFQYNGGSSVVYAGTLTLNTWLHVAASRSGSTGRLFLDGTVIETNASFANGTLDTVANVVVGRAGSDLASGYFNGNAQDLVIVKGDPVHTANFTPPARLVAPVAGTITDDAGAPVERRIWVIPRTWPTRMFSGLSDPGDGSYSIDAPNVECARIVLDDAAGTQHNDLIDRVDAAA